MKQLGPEQLAFLAAKVRLCLGDRSSDTADVLALMRASATWPEDAEERAFARMRARVIGSRP